MKRNYLLLIITTFLLMFITVSYAAFSRELLITGEGSILKDNTPPTCGAWYLRDSSLTIQEAYNQNKFINPGTNDTWTNTNKKLFIECTDNMAGDLGCINVTEITDSNNQKRYFKEVIEYTTTTQTDSNIITVTLQDAFLNQTTCTLPVGGSNPYIDKQGPTVTITQSAANKFTYSATDDIGVTGYMVTTTSTVPALDNANWVSTPSEVTIDNTTSKTYYVWAKDEANVTNSTINTYLLTKTEGTGTTLTLRYNNSSGTILNTGYVLNGTPVYVSGELKPGYNSITLTKTTTSISVINNNTTQTINSNTTITSGSTANTYTVSFNSNGGSGTMSSQVMNYGTSTALRANAFSRSGYTFLNWNTKSDGTGTSYTNKQSVSNLTTTNNGTVTLYAQWNPNATFDTGQNVNQKMKRLAGNSSASYYSTNTNITTIVRSSTEPSASNKTSAHVVSTSSSITPIYMWFENGTMYWWSECIKPFFNSNSSYMFSIFNGLTSLDLSSFNTSNVTNMGSMFDESSSLTNLDLSNFNTSKVTNMGGMFYGCSNLTSLNLSNFNTSNVTSMGSMFSGCSSLTSLDISSFNTSKVTRMSQMFYNCSSLTSLDISSFNTAKVTEMYTMFYNCSSLTSLDLSSFNMSLVTDQTDNIFYGMSNLVRLKTPSAYSGSKIVVLPKKMLDSNNNAYSILTSTSPTSTWLEFDLDITEFDIGKNVIVKMKKLAGNSSASYSTSDTSITSIQKSLSEPSASNKTEEHKVSSSTSKYPIYMWYDNGTIYWWSQESNPYFNSDSNSFFYGLKSITDLDLSSFNTSNVVDMHDLFTGCSVLTSLDLSSFDTSYVVYMYYMFEGCSSLTSLDLSSFNTSNVIRMHYMFEGCSSLTSLDLSSFNMIRVDNANGMINTMVSLERLKTPNAYPNGFDIGLPRPLFDSNENKYFILNVTSPTSTWLEYDSNITELDIGKNVNAKMKKLAGTSSATHISDNTNITSIQKSLNEPSAANKTENNIVSTPVSKYPIYMWYENGTMYWWSQVDIVSLNSNSVYLFSYLKGLTSIDLSSFNASNVTDMSYMFYQCSSLTSLNLSTFNTSNVTNMNSMFYNCSSLTSLNLSTFNTSNVTNMNAMFYGCSSLTSLSLSSFDTSNVTNMTLLFYNCSSLTSLDLSNFDTSKVNYINHMFYNCSSLTNLNLSTFNTSNVTGGMAFMFNNCSKLTSLDLSNFTFTASNVTSSSSLNSMLTGMSALKKLKTPSTYTANYNISLPKTMYTTAGTAYSSLTKNTPKNTWLASQTIFDTGQNVNQKMKRLAGNSSAYYYTTNTNITTITRSSTEPTSANKTSAHVVSASSSGYPIYMWYENGTMYWWSECSKPFFNSNASSMFYNCRGLTSIDLSPFVTNSVTNMSYMFYGCSSLTSLNVSSFNTSNVTNMSSMFRDCSSLTSLNLSSFNTSKVTSMDSMFDNCSSLTSLDLSSFNTNNVTSMSSMFNNCSSLTSLDLSSFNMNKVTVVSKMLCDMSGLQSLKTPNTYPSSVSIDLPRKMMDTNNNEYLTLTSSSPTSTWLEYDPNITEFDTGQNVNVKIKKLAGNSTAQVSSKNTNITSIQKSLTEPSSTNKTEEHIVSSKVSKHPIYMWYDNGTIYWWSEESNPYLNTDSYNMFYEFNGLISVDLSSFNTSNVKMMYQMFSGCSSLTSLDLSTFDTSNITSVFSAFKNCNSLISIDLGSFNTSNVTSVDSMFYGCSSLTSLDLSSFNMNKVTGTGNMLRGMSALQSLKTPNTYPSSGIIELPRKMLDTNNNEYLALTSSSPTSTWLESDPNITEFDTGQNVNQKMKRLAGNSSATYSTTDTSITSIQKSLTEPSSSNKTEEHIVSTPVSKYPIYMWFENGTIYWWSEESNPYFGIDSSYMFADLTGLTSLDLSSFNTSNVTNMSNMFYYSTGLINLDISSFNTSNVTDMSYMFCGCSKITILDLSSFNMSNVTSLSRMLYNMTKLTDLKTPSAYPSSGTIDLPKTMYNSSGTAFSSLSSTSPTSTWLYSTKP